MLCLPAIAAAQGTAGLSPLDCLQTLLQRDPQIRVQRTMVSESEGWARQYRAPFDFQTAFVAQYGKDHSPVISPLGIVFPDVATGQYQVTFGQQLDVGASLSGNFGVVSTTILDGTSTDTRPQNRAIYSLTLGVPLLKNRGAATMHGAREEASLLVLAAKADLKAATNARAMDALTAWLEYWYSSKLHEMANSSLLDADTAVNDVRAFLHADRRTRSDLDLARATSLQRKADLIAAAQRVATARFLLAVTLGDSLSRASGYEEPTPLQHPSDTNLARTVSSSDVRAVAARERPDVIAFAARRMAAQRAIEGLQSGADPQLDLSLMLGANGFNLNTGASAYVSPYTQNVTPLNFGVGLTWTFPVQNSAAAGTLDVRAAQATRTEVQSADLLRTIALQTELAVFALRSAAERMIVAREGLDLARLVYDAEEFRMRNNASTLVILREMQNNSIAAETTYLSSKRDYYQAVLQLRFLTSSFVREDGRVHEGAAWQGAHNLVYILR